MQDISGKVQVVLCEGSAHIIVVLVPALRHLNQLGYNAVIGAAAVRPAPNPVIGLLPSVQAQDYV